MSRFDISHWDVSMLDSIVVGRFSFRDALVPLVFDQGNGGAAVSVLGVVHYAFSCCYDGWR